MEAFTQKMIQLTTDKRLTNNLVVGWPGLYWLEKTADQVEMEAPKHVYFCNINNGEICQTHGIVRGLNWWNDLYQQLSKSLIRSN